MKRRYWLIGIPLSILLGVPLLCIGLLIFGSYYGQWRMDAARTEMFELAEMLGYEPGSHLFDSVETSNVNIVSGSARCSATLLYTTSLSGEKFKERLDQLPWESVAQTGLGPQWSALYSSVELTADGLSYEDNWVAYSSKFDRAYHGIWGLKGKSVSIYFYDITSLDVRLEHKGRPFDQNVVYISIDGGEFPIWLNCPIQYNREPSVSS